MIHTILPPEALQPQAPLPASEWIQCPEGWVQAIRGAEGGLTVQSICSTEFDEVVNALREDAHFGGILRSRGSLSACRKPMPPLGHLHKPRRKRAT